MRTDPADPGTDIGQTAGGEEPFFRIARYLLLLGAAWRLLRYGLRFPLWGDEASIVLNVMDSPNWAGALRPGREQVSPFLFLWAEKASLAVLGPSEMSLRLVPLAAGLLGLVLFWRLARLALEPLPAAIATGILSVSYFPLRFSCEVKSYSSDLCVSVAFLLLGLLFLSEPGRLRPLALLLVAAPVGVGLSYPGILVLAAVSLVLLPVVWRRGDARVWLLFLAYNAAGVATFLYGVLAAGVGQFQGQGGFQNQFWQHSFPPWQPVALLVWLVRIHAGNLFAYPLGDVEGLNTLTFVLAVAGIVILRKTGRRGLLPLFLLPFAWTFLAAAVRLYPYGGHPRVAQHLAPPICLLAGTGLAAALKLRDASGEKRVRRVRVTAGVFATLAVVGMVLDVLTPYKSGGDAVFRRFVADIKSRSGPGDRVLFFEPARNEVPSPLEFYARRAGLDVSWTGKLDPAPPPPGQVWVIAYRLSAAPEAAKEQLARASPPFVLEEDRFYPLSKGADRDPPVPCSVSLWKRAGS